MKKLLSITMLCLLLVPAFVFARYTTKGQNIIDQQTGKTVILKGIGLGGWLLPEGYMWGIRKLDRPRQFEQAIVDLIGKEDAAEFWKLYHDNYVTKEDIEAFKMWGINSIRIPLLASQLQPRENQPDKAPYVYSDEGFRFLDSIVEWCTEYKIGVIWDMHGAPGGQNAENISDSDGKARLWTEAGKYWPMLNDLWLKIAKRYQGKECIIGYDLLNEPLLRRYEGISTDLLREIYIQLTQTIRTVDKEGIIFVEGDDWAQNFDMLEPIDWDDHLVLAFHSYPPTTNQKGLQRWDNLRQKYNVPLWHGETGEQRPPYNINVKATTFCDSVNVSWAWWTHKKFENQTQPWEISRTKGFETILAYWNGNAERPDKEQAKEWLFEQARLTNTQYCKFLPDMVRSLVPLNPYSYIKKIGNTEIGIISQSSDVEVENGYSAEIQVKAYGFPLNYQWFKDGKLLEGQTGSSLIIGKDLKPGTKTVYDVEVSNETGKVKSKPITVTGLDFKGPSVTKTKTPPVIDGIIDKVWNDIPAQQIAHSIQGEMPETNDLSGYFKLSYDDQNFYILADITDDTLINSQRAGYQNDGIEVYIDTKNEKPGRYTDNTFAFRYVEGDSVLSAQRTKPGEGIKQAQSITPSGYVMEIQIPWKSVGGFCDDCEFMGFDISVNDNDSKRRESKLSWHYAYDNAYRNPGIWGVVEIKK